jgi:hypothetical protein
VAIDGVWIANWIIEHLQNVTTNKYSGVANSRTLQLATTRTNSSQLAVSSPVVWYRLSMADLPLTLHPRTIPVSQLPASNSNRSEGLNGSNSLTHSVSRVI